MGQPEAPPPHKFHPAVLGWVLCAVFVLYPLSIGPAAKVHQAFPGCRPAIEAVYAPLVYLIERSPQARALFIYYLEMVWGLK